MLFDDINKVEIMGNLTSDPESRFTANGSQVVSFSVATNRSYKVGEDWKEEVAYHNIVVWGNLAGQLATRVQKGTRVLVTGRLQTRSWEGTDGKKNYKTEIVADNVILIARYLDGAGGDASNSMPAGVTTGDKIAAKAQTSQETITDEEIDPNDLPF